MADDDKYWERVKRIFPTQFQVDVRWILRAHNDTRAHGGLRIVSHPDLPPGHLNAFITIVTKRKNKSMEEIEDFIEKYFMEEKELKEFSISEHIDIWQNKLTEPLHELEKILKIKVFGK